MEEMKADIFISYAHLDDEVIMGDEGWVSRFHKYLEPRLKMVTGNKQIRIWRDDKLTGNDDFAEEIYDQLSENVLLICIYSPSYVNSPWCGREVDLFVKGKNQDYKVGNKSRIFKVSKIKIDRTREPDFMQRLLGYRFYDEKGMEYEEGISPEAKRAYHDKLNDLTHDLAELLELLKTSKSEKQVEDKLSIYVADSPDCLMERDKIIRELTAQGYDTLPAQSLSITDENAYIDQTRDLIDQAAVYVQLFGEEYGQRFTSGKSLLHRQYEESLSQALNNAKPSFYWVKRVPNRGESMGGFLKEFQQQMESISADDESEIFVLQDRSIEELNLELSSVLGKLKGDLTPKEEAEETVQQSSGSLLLLLSTDDMKAKAFVPLYKLLSASGIETRFQIVDQANDSTLSALLESCSRIMIYYGAGSYDWLLATLGKLDGLANAHEKALFVFKAAPETIEKEILVSNRYTIIDGITETDLNVIPELSQLIASAK